MSDLPASKQIDNIIGALDDWRAVTLANLRKAILASSPDITEEVKWKKPSKPEGVAVWMSNGNLCMADVLKNAVRLTFPKGAAIKDPYKLFNTRLDSKTVRAVDYFEGQDIDAKVLSDVILQAAKLNQP